MAERNGLPIPSGGNQNVEHSEAAIKMHKSDIKKNSKHAKTRSRKGGKKSEEESVTRRIAKAGGNLSTSATPISMPSVLTNQTTKTKVRTHRTKSKPDTDRVVLRTERQLRNYFSAMDRVATRTDKTPSLSPKPTCSRLSGFHFTAIENTVAQTDTAPSPQPTRSCLSRSSFGSNGSGQSNKSVHFADLENESVLESKRAINEDTGRVSAASGTSERDNPHLSQACSSKTLADEHGSRCSETETNQTTTNHESTKENTNGADARSQFRTSRTTNFEETREIANQATESGSHDKYPCNGRSSHSVSTISYSRSNSRNSDSQTESLTSSSYTYLDRFSSSSNSSIEEHSRTGSRYSGHSNESIALDTGRNSERYNHSSDNNVTEDREVSEELQNSKPEKESSRSSPEYRSRSESGFHENNNSRCEVFDGPILCGSSVSGADAGNYEQTLDVFVSHKMTKSADNDPDSTEDSKIDKSQGKRSRRRLSSPKQRNKPKPEDKVFRREPIGTCPGSKVLKIDFQYENKAQNQNKPSACEISKPVKPARKLSPDVDPGVNHSEIPVQAVNSLSVTGVPMQTKDRPNSSPDAVEYPYDNDFENEVESDITRKDSPVSQQSQDSFWDVSNEKDSQVKRDMAPKASNNAGKLPLIKRSQEMMDLSHNKGLGIRSSEPDQKTSEISMVGTGFELMATATQEEISPKIEKKDAKARGNKIDRGKPLTLQNDSRDLSALIAKELLGDKYKPRVVNKTEHTIGKPPKPKPEKVVEKLKIYQQSTLKQKQSKTAKEVLSKKTKIESLVAAENLYPVHQQRHLSDMVVMGTAKSSPYLNTEAGSAPKACSATSILPNIHNAGADKAGRSVITGNNDPPSNTVLPKLRTSGLIPQPRESRVNDHRRDTNTVRVPCSVDHSHGDIGYHQRRTEMRTEQRKTVSANNSTLPHLLGTPGPLHAEATVCNGALEVTIENPTDKGVNSEHVNIKLTIQHKSRCGQRYRSSGNQVNCGNHAEPSRSKNVVAMKNRKIKRGLPQN